MVSLAAGLARRLSPSPIGRSAVAKRRSSADTISPEATRMSRTTGRLIGTGRADQAGAQPGRRSMNASCALLLLASAGHCQLSALAICLI